VTVPAPYASGAPGGQILPAMGIPASYLSCVMGTGRGGDITFSSSILSVAQPITWRSEELEKARLMRTV